MTPAAFPTPRPLVAFEGSFPPLVVHQMSPSGLADAVEGLQALIDSIPRARSAEEIAEELKLGNDYCSLDRLIDELADGADYQSDDDEKALGCALLEDLHSVKASADRLIGRLAARRAGIEAAQTFGDA